MRQNKQLQQVRVRPGKAGPVLLLVMGVMFLVFGLVLVGTGASDTSDEGLRTLLFLFGAIWAAACLSMIGYGLYSLMGKRPRAALELEIEENNKGARGANERGDFDERLRKLEALRREGLIQQDEYEKQRAGIMEEKW